MVTQFLTEVEPSISSARLIRYRSASTDPLDTAVNYLWNIELCEAFYYSLHAVEISLRNGFHQSLTLHFGVPHWYDKTGILEPDQKRDVKKAKARIMRSGSRVTPDRVVSELTFGFWVTILSRNYDARLWSANNAASLKNAFMKLPRRQRQRQGIHQPYTRSGNFVTA